MRREKCEHAEQPACEMSRRRANAEWGRRRFGSETGANALQTGANAPAVTVYAATSELEKAIERQHEVNCLIAVKNQKLVALKAECNDKVEDGQTPRTNPR